MKNNNILNIFHPSKQNSSFLHSADKIVQIKLEILYFFTKNIPTIFDNI